MFTLCYFARLQEERAPMAPIVNASFPVLLGLMQQLVANSSPTPQVAEFMKLVCKVRCGVRLRARVISVPAAD
jgi:hypothetical protein